MSELKNGPTALFSSDNFPFPPLVMVCRTGASDSIDRLGLNSSRVCGGEEVEEVGRFASARRSVVT